MSSVGLRRLPRFKPLDFIGHNLSILAIQSHRHEHAVIGRGDGLTSADEGDLAAGVNYANGYAAGQAVRDRQNRAE